MMKSINNISKDMGKLELNATWISVNDELPSKTGWYLVFAPNYMGGSSSALGSCDGIMFSKFTCAKNGNKSWSVESKPWRNGGCVKYWMELPAIPEEIHIETNTTNSNQMTFDF